VVTAPHSLGSMAGCTVLQPHQILPYLAALPQASAAS
jgi:hypothetical protein